MKLDFDKAKEFGKSIDCNSDTQADIGELVFLIIDNFVKDFNTDDKSKLEELILDLYKYYIRYWQEELKKYSPVFDKFYTYDMYTEWFAKHEISFNNFKKAYDELDNFEKTLDDEDKAKLKIIKDEIIEVRL